MKAWFLKCLRKSGTIALRTGFIECKNVSMLKGDIWKYNKIIKIFCVALVLGLKHHLKKDQLLEAVKLEHAKVTAIMKNIIGKCQLNDIVENLQNLYLHICYVILQNRDW
jgi:hypothetical protein